jgi:hypothetical protein
MDMNKLIATNNQAKSKLLLFIYYYYYVLAAVRHASDPSTILFMAERAIAY